VQAFEMSTEFRLRSLNMLYQTILGRTIDPTGQAGWLSFLAQGGTLEQVEAAILGSPEFFQRSGGTNLGFLQNLYATVLGRTIDAGAQTAFTNALNGGLSRQVLATFVLDSPEAVQRDVESFYQQFLGRQADAGGLSAFTAAGAAGLSDEAITALIISSPEYLSRACSTTTGTTTGTTTSTTTTGSTTTSTTTGTTTTGGTTSTM
jgi:hypothetical protein